MPILQYRCPECGKKFEELVKRFDEAVICPVCGRKAERVWAGEMYSSTGKRKKNCNGHCGTCGGCE